MAYNRARPLVRTRGRGNGVMADMWRCLIIEDDQENGPYLARELERHGHMATLAQTGQQGLSLATGQAWDIIILDRMLPDTEDGLSILASLRQQGDQTPVLVLSALTALDERVKGLQAGSDDYLIKPFALSELIARMEALVRRIQHSPDEEILSIADLRLNLFTRKVERQGQAINLQPREFMLLAFLLRHAGQVVTRTMLLESVWGYHFDPQTNVIDVQISRLRNKLEAGFDLPLIHTVRGVGYMLSVSPPLQKPDSS